MALGKWHQHWLSSLGRIRWRRQRRQTRTDNGGDHHSNTNDNDVFMSTLNDMRLARSMMGGSDRWLMQTIGWRCARLFSFFLILFLLFAVVQRRCESLELWFGYLKTLFYAVRFCCVCSCVSYCVRWTNQKQQKIAGPLHQQWDMILAMCLFRLFCDWLCVFGCIYFLFAVLLSVCAFHIISMNFSVAGSESHIYYECMVTSQTFDLWRVAFRLFVIREA